MKKVLFVCLGNICRSPMAEGMMQELVEQNGLSDKFYIDSAGTSAHHIGERADERMRKKASEYGVELKSRARQVEVSDFEEFDFVLAMDESNYHNLVELASEHGKPTNHIELLRNYDDVKDNINVPDPYYGGEDGFEEVYQIVKRSCSNLLNHI